MGVFEVGQADWDGTEHGGDCGTGDGTDGGLALLVWEVDVGAGEGLEDCLGFCCDALVVEAEGDDGLFADLSGVHSCDDFLAEVAAFGEVDSGVHDAGFCGDGVWAEVDVVEGVACFDACGVDGEPAGGPCLAFGGEGLVDGFELVFGDSKGKTDLAGEVEAVGDNIGVVY